MSDRPLPPNPSIPIANLATCSLTKLVNGDRDEMLKMLHAFENEGFMYLALENVNSLDDDWSAILTFMREYFNQPLQRKMEDAKGSDIVGYEPCGSSAGVFEDHVDAYESLKISRSQILSIDHHGNVAGARTQKDLFKRFVGAANSSMVKLLECLSELCPKSVHFEAAHEASLPSTTTLSMFRYPRQEPGQTAKATGHNKHTDIGTLTFLLTKSWGLQVLQAANTPSGYAWTYVEPRAGHAIINVGDSLRFLSGARFRSAVHRVVPVSGLDESGYPVVEDHERINVRQGEDRYSIAYFLRPSDDTVYATGQGTCTAREWHDAKFNMFRQPRDYQDALGIHTGGMESGDALVSG